MHVNPANIHGINCFFKYNKNFSVLHAMGLNLLIAQAVKIIIYFMKKMVLA